MPSLYIENLILSLFFLQGDQVFKSVFIIFFQGDQLKTRVKKICEGFRATLYPCPEAPADRREMAMGVMTRIEDLNTVSAHIYLILKKRICWSTISFSN